jgi:hypothetical protein
VADKAFGGGEHGEAVAAVDAAGVGQQIAGKQESKKEQGCAAVFGAYVKWASAHELDSLVD